jgi:hypothetical protein
VQATPQGLVKCHEILKALKPYDLQLLLRLVKRTLSIKLTEVVVDAAAKAHLCQVVRILRGAYQRPLRGQLLLEVTWIAFSYCATAVLRAILDAIRLALLAPPAKSGTLI